MSRMHAVLLGVLVDGVLKEEEAAFSDDPVRCLRSRP